MPNAKRTKFTLDHRLLREDAALANLALELEALSPINSQQSFNHYCRAACQLWQQFFPQGHGATSIEFERMAGKISAGKIPNQVIPTSWGGVVIVRYTPPIIEKYLVVKCGGYLALETHDAKREHIEVKEGRGLLLWSESESATLLVEKLRPGSEYQFSPGMMHCIIGTEDLLILERGNDPKGMDQDLVFIYTPD